VKTLVSKVTEGTVTVREFELTNGQEAHPIREFPFAVKGMPHEEVEIRVFGDGRFLATASNHWNTPDFDDKRTPTVRTFASMMSKPTYELHVRFSDDSLQEWQQHTISGIGILNAMEHGNLTQACLSPDGNLAAVWGISGPKSMAESA